jgi:LPXTG-motif cell wall-anchored protein
VTTQPETTQPETTQPATTQPTTEDDDEEPTEPQTIPTTEAATETLVAEELPLGEASIFDFDSFQSNLTTETTEAVEEIVIDDEETPLADALPQTGQLPVELFYGIGGLISAAGVFLKRKR